MQEITFAAPKAGPKAKPTGAWEAAAEVAPVDRRSRNRGREDDFGSVVDADERASAKKPAGETGKTAGAGADAVPSAEADAGDKAAMPTVDEDEFPVEHASEDAVEFAVPNIETDAMELVDPAGQAPVEAAEAVVAGVPDQMVVAAASAPAQAVPGTAPRRTEASAGTGAANPPVPPGASPQAADVAPEAEPEEAPVARRGPEAPAAGAHSSEIRPAAVVAPQTSPPASPVGIALGALVSDGLDWRLTPRAHAPAATHPPAQAQPQAVTGQIAVAIAHSANSRIEVRLDPPELGRVQIQLNPTERGVQVIVMSEWPETGDFLRRHAETLSRDLTEAGFENVTMEFSAGGSDTPGERNPAEAPAPPRLAVAGASVSDGPTVPEPSRPMIAGTLDIRL